MFVHHPWHGWGLVGGFLGWSIHPWVGVGGGRCLTGLINHPQGWGWVGVALGQSITHRGEGCVNQEGWGGICPQEVRDGKCFIRFVSYPPGFEGMGPQGVDVVSVSLGWSTPQWTVGGR